MAEKKDKTEKADKPEKTGGNLKDAIIEQAINEFTRPLVKRINPATLQLLHKVGIDKILPVIGVGFSTALREKFGSKTADVISELTAELRRAIGEAAEGGVTAPETKPEKGKVSDTVLSVIFNPEIAKETKKLVEAWADLFKKDGQERPKKEQQQIIALIGRMGPQELYIFLTQKKTLRDQALDAFIKKTTEKPFEEAVKEFKEDVKKIVANAKTIYQEILAPIGQKIKPHLENAGRRLEAAYNQINNDCAEDGTVGQQVIAIRQRARTLRQWSENFRQNRRR